MLDPLISAKVGSLMKQTLKASTPERGNHIALLQKAPRGANSFGAFLYVALVVTRLQFALIQQAESNHKAMIFLLNQ